MKETVELALTMAALGQIGICATILMMRSVRTQAYLPLALFFVAAAIVVAGPAIRAFAPAHQSIQVALSLPAYLTLGPSLWLYVNGLTSETPWRLRIGDFWHFVLVGAGLIAALLVIALPTETRDAMLIQGALVDQWFPKILMLGVFVLILGWIAQSGYYLVRVFRHLSSYRHRLRDLFASNERRELHWLGWLIIIIGGVWVVSLVTLISDNFGGLLLVNQQTASLMGLVLVWLIGVWGLRQKPGFEGRYLEPEKQDPPAHQVEGTVTEKYKRSALQNDQAQRIAAKIENAMVKDKLYLDPNLSLHKLAKTLSISPNYISQTLNETIGETFFDYVNRWRVEAAKDRVAAGNETVLQIALDAGFNARSSFYKAFGKVTGMTPGAFRRSLVVNTE